MIILERLFADVRGTAKPFMSGVDLVLPSDRLIALLGTEYEQTMTFMHLLSGLLPPRAGRVIRKANVSFPVGYLGGFTSALPVRQNVAYLARIYGADVGTTVRFVRRTAGLSYMFDRPYGELPKDTKTHLGSILAYALPFDTYLLLKQPKSKRDKKPDAVHELFKARSRIAGMIMPVTNRAVAAEHCEIALVYAEGSFRLYDDMDEAFNSLKPAETAGQGRPSDENLIAAGNVRVVDVSRLGTADSDRSDERKLARRRKKRKLARRERRGAASSHGGDAARRN